MSDDVKKEALRKAKLRAKSAYKSLSLQQRMLRDVQMIGIEDLQIELQTALDRIARRAGSVEKQELLSAGVKLEKRSDMQTHSISMDGKRAILGSELRHLHLVRAFFHHQSYASVEGNRLCPRPCVHTMARIFTTYFRDFYEGNRYRPEAKDKTFLEMKDWLEGKDERKMAMSSTDHAVDGNGAAV